MNKKKLLYSIFLMLTIIITGTLAYFTIVTDRTALVLTLGEQDEVLVTLEPFEINGTLSSTVNYTSLEDYIQVTAENFSALPKKVIFYYRINSIDSTLINTKLKYSITSSNTIDGTYSEAKTGNFSTAAEGHDLTVFEFDIPANTTIFYRVYTYLDGSQNVSSMTNSLIETEFRAEMEHIITPELDEGMIPVKYTFENNEIKVITATNDSTWFDYDNHIWANVALVTESSRSKYLGTTGENINPEDLLATLVWIPRYEYRHNNLGTSYAGGTQSNPGAIAINFIPSYVTIPTSSAYKIHPAFTFGDTEISGFWVGNDRLVGEKETPLMGYVDNTNEIQLKLSEAFETSLKFCGGTLNNGEVTFSGSSYYGTTSNFDSHLMKTSEYGAIAYLTQSIYGKCTSTTSCAALESEDWTTNYNSENVSALLSGVHFEFDTNRKESVMGVFQYDSNFIYTGNTSGINGNNSGFVGYIGDILYDTDIYKNMPPAKYYDRYTSTNSATACNGNICYGHALSEVDGWYGHTDISFVTSSNPWLNFGNTVNAGNFVNGNSSGAASAVDFYRAVILNQNGPSGGTSGGNNGPTGATMLINKANDASITTYSSGDSGEMYTFSQPATAQLGATTDYRYIGSNPNNYITFNDETWRIIGVFDGKIKIIRDERIGNTTFSWDYKQSGIGSSTSTTGSNDWVDSQLMYMLNPNDIATNVALKTGYTYDGTYVKDASGNIIYQKGCKPESTDGTSYSCTSNTWSLNDTALTQVADVTYYLGGSSSSSGQSASSYYTFERGVTKYNSVRSTSWNGKVGLMYPSDYAYTFAYGVDDKCYSDTYNCDTSIPTSSWLYTSSYMQWTLSPNSSGANLVFYVVSSGYVSNHGSRYTDGVRPVVYLKSDIILTGTGTVDDKYVIG